MTVPKARPNPALQQTASREIVRFFDVMLCSALAAAECQPVGRQPNQTCAHVNVCWYTSHASDPTSHENTTIQMSEQPQSEGIWCLVANVAPEQVYAVEQEVRRGTKHFSPNTKVYCFPPAWGDGYEDIRVIGRHRGSARLVTLIMPSRRLINWRVKYVCHPVRYAPHLGGLDESARRADVCVHALQP